MTGFAYETGSCPSKAARGLASMVKVATRRALGAATCNALRSMCCARMLEMLDEGVASKGENGSNRKALREVWRSDCGRWAAGDGRVEARDRLLDSRSRFLPALRRARLGESAFAHAVINGIVYG